jgi:hypothetical protein
MSPLGHSRRFDHVREESDLPLTPDLLRHRNKLTFTNACAPKREEIREHLVGLPSVGEAKLGVHTINAALATEITCRP